MALCINAEAGGGLSVSNKKKRKYSPDRDDDKVCKLSSKYTGISSRKHLSSLSNSFLSTGSSYVCAPYVCAPLEGKCKVEYDDLEEGEIVDSPSPAPDVEMEEEVSTNLTREGSQGKSSGSSSDKGINRSSLTDKCDMKIDDRQGHSSHVDIDNHVNQTTVNMLEACRSVYEFENLGKLGDDSIWWDGLACPPMEDFAFTFDTNFMPDDMLDDPLLALEEEDDEDEKLDKMVAECMVNPLTPLSHDLLDLLPTNFNSGQDFGREDGKADVGKSYGKGKQLKTLRLVLQVDKYGKTNHDSPSKQQRDQTNHKSKADYELRMEGKVIRIRRCKNHGKGKELEYTNRLDVGNKGKSDHRDQLDVVDKTMNNDYDLKFEASRHKLHELYQRSADAKQQRQIQIIDFQIPVTKQQRCNAKSKRKPSLRHKLMAMETRKCNKKFPMFKTFSSCIH